MNVTMIARAALVATLSLAVLDEASAQVTTAPSPTSATPATKAASGAAPAKAAPKRRIFRKRVQSTSAQTDGRTGGDPVSSARTPGGPPDDVNTGLTAPLPSLGKSRP